MVARRLIAIIFVSLISAESIQIPVDKNKLEEGELLQLNIQVIDGEDFAKVDLGPLETDFQIVNGPSQQNNIQAPNRYKIFNIILYFQRNTRSFDF